MLTIIYQTFILYFLVVIAMRIMGKRQIGQLQPFELASAIMVSELAAIPISEPQVELWKGIVPILIVVISQVFLSYLSLKNLKMREWICGRPIIMVQNGKILESNLRKELFSVNDLLEQLRINNIRNLSDVEFAILETNGQLSIISKSQKRPITPEDLQIDTSYEGMAIDLIIDGKIHHENLKNINLDEQWLIDQLKIQGFKKSNEILYAALDTQGKLFIQGKEKK